MSAIPCDRLHYIYVHVVKDYADTTMTTRSSTIHFDVRLLVLKDQSGEIKYFGVFTYPVAIILTWKIGEKAKVVTAVSETEFIKFLAALYCFAPG